MRLICSLVALLLLSACGSQTPSSLWNEVTDPPEGWHGAAPSEMKGYEPASTEAEQEPVYQAEEVILIEDDIVPMNEPTQIAK